MKTALLAFSCLMFVLFAAWLVGLGLGQGTLYAQVPDARPTPTPDRPLPPGPLTPPEIPAMPDLVVEQIQLIPDRPNIYQQVEVRVTIANRGSSDVEPGNNFFVDLYIDPDVVPIQLGQDGQVTWGAQSWWVPQDTSYIVTATIAFSDVKVYALYAQVDTDGHVAEENENNNVFGPKMVLVVSPGKVLHQSHKDFQMGLASGLDLTHPMGVMRRGIFVEPSTEPEVYRPDNQVNAVTGTLQAGEWDPITLNQVHPALIGSASGMLYAAWEDGRNGGVYNRDIYFASSPNQGATWSRPDVRVLDDPISHEVNQVNPDLAYDNDRHRLYAVWQDGRNDNYDIYFAYSTNDGATWSTNIRLNDDIGVSAQMNPSIFVELVDNPNIYVVWQDKRNGNDDVYLVRSADGGLTWSSNYFVTDDPSMTLQNQVAPSVGADSHFVSGEHGVVYVCWEDWRVGLHPNIYCARSLDQGATFGIDVPVSNIDKDPNAFRLAPSMVVTMSRELVDIWDPIQEITITKAMDISALHVAWQEGEDEDAEIYYAYSVYLWDYPLACPYPYDFCFDAMQKVSGFIIDSDYVLPDEPRPVWDTEPSWQGQVDLALASANDWTQCHAFSNITYSLGVFISWSDASSFDDWRYEIQNRRAASPSGFNQSFEVCEDQATGVVNDNAKLYLYRDNLDMYRSFKPSATRQSNPSVFARIPPSPTFGPLLYVSWDDDRWDAPMEPNTVRNRDVYMARWGSPYEAIYVSPVMDAGGESTWYVLDWWGATEHFGDLLMQTRLGWDPYPPQEDVATATWTRWTGNPSSTYLGCQAGAGCYYDAPGRHIVGATGAHWPKSRYIQYKITIRGSSRLTALSQVTIHYQGPQRAYLPAVVKH